MGGRPGSPRSTGVTLSLEQGAHLVRIARSAIETAVTERRIPRSDELPVFAVGADEFLKSNRGAFVTLTNQDGGLRGCIGLPYPVKPLGETVVHAAVGAATRDPRFPRVSPSELGSLMIEVSALTAPEAIECDPSLLPAYVRIGTDGLIVSSDGASGLLLPQVATEMGLSPEAFLTLTCQKAGLHPDAWQTPGVEVRRFQAEIFGEEMLRGIVGGPRASP